MGVTPDGDGGGVRTTAPAGGFPARHQPSQRYVPVDAGMFGAQDLPSENRMLALIGCEAGAEVPDRAERANRCVKSGRT